MKMIDYIKEPHTSIFIAQTGCGKTHLILELIEKEYNNHCDYIIIICPSFRENNKTSHTKDWVKNDDSVWLVDPKIISINGLKSFQNIYHFSMYYS